MLNRIRRRLSYANVVASVALFMALGGVGYAATASKNSVVSSSIKNGQVKTVDLASSSVTSAKIRNGQVSGTDIANGTISRNDLGSTLKTDMDDATTLGGATGAALQAGATDVRQATGARTFSGTSPAANATTVTLNLPAGTWLVHFRAHAVAAASSLTEKMAVSYTPNIGATSLGVESITLTTDFSAFIVAVGAKQWDRTALVTTTAAKTVTLVTSAVANGGDWTGGGRSLSVSNAAIIAEKVGTATGATAIP